MGDLHGPNRPQRVVQRRLCRAAVAAAQVLLHLAERAQHSRTIEPLPLTMLAESHFHSVSRTRPLPAGTRTADNCVYRTKTRLDRKSTRLNSSHGYISYAVFCLKKKKTQR